MADTRGALEAILFVASEPVPLSELAAAVGQSEAQTLRDLRALAAEYAEGERGFVLREAGAGWRMYTNSLFSDVVSAYVVRENSGRLSTAALETLAVIAYQQPVTRAQISAIRGVNVDSVVRTLLHRGLIAEVASDGALQYGTTPYFLEAMGMTSLAELAPLAPYLPEVHDIDE